MWILVELLRPHDTISQWYRSQQQRQLWLDRAGLTTKAVAQSDNRPTLFVCPVMFLFNAEYLQESSVFQQFKSTACNTVGHCCAPERCSTGNKQQRRASDSIRRSAETTLQPRTLNKFLFPDKCLANARRRTPSASERSPARPNKSEEEGEKRKEFGFTAQQKGSGSSADKSSAARGAEEERSVK